MARGGISEEQVRRVIKQLDAKNIQPTVNAIRKELGTGSFSTISAVLSVWREEQKTSTRPAVPPVPDDVSALFQQLWQEAFRSADAFAEAEREKFAKDRLALDRTASEMSLEISRLEDSLREVQNEREAFKKQLEAKDDELRKEQVERAKAETAFRAASLELTGLRETIAKGQEQLAPWVERATRAETKLEQLSKKKGQ